MLENTVIRNKELNNINGRIENGLFFQSVNKKG